LLAVYVSEPGKRTSYHPLLRNLRLLSIDASEPQFANYPAIADALQPRFPGLRTPA